MRKRTLKQPRKKWNNFFFFLRTLCLFTFFIFVIAVLVSSLNLAKEFFERGFLKELAFEGTSGDKGLHHKEKDHSLKESDQINNSKKATSLIMPDSRSSVAVYLTGQARTFNRTWCSIVENIFEPLLESKYYDKIVVFVVAERDSVSHTYSEVLLRLQEHKIITVGQIVTLERPSVEGKNESKHVEMTQIPNKCYEGLAYKGRWYHNGGNGINSKNGKYTAELLSQLYYRKRVDKLRQQYEEVHEIEFKWIILARPDTVYIDHLLTPESIHNTNNTREDYSNDLFTVHWGGGFNQYSWNHAKHVPGMNDRFAFSGRMAMTKLMGMYDVLCSLDYSDNLQTMGTHFLKRSMKTTIPPKMNLEQLTYWYLREVQNVTIRFFPPTFRFLFYRLRTNSYWPLEHPNHRPALVAASRRERLFSYKKAIEMLHRCEFLINTQQEIITTKQNLERVFFPVKKDDYGHPACIWRVSLLLYWFLNIFFLPNSWVHRYICFLC